MSMKKIIKVLLIGLFTLFVGYNMLSAQEVSLKDGWTIIYNTDSEDMYVVETAIDNIYDRMVIAYDFVSPKEKIYPEDISDLLETVNDTNMRNMVNKTFSYARKYAESHLISDEISLVVLYSKYETVNTYVYFFWFYN